MEKITTYTATGGKLEKEEESIYQVAQLISMATGKDPDAAQALALECEKEGKRLIFAYPPFEADSAGWEELGEIPDGMLYLG